MNKTLSNTTFSVSFSCRIAFIVSINGGLKFNTGLIINFIASICAGVGKHFNELNKKPDGSVLVICFFAFNNMSVLT